MSVVRALSWVPMLREWFTADFAEEAAYSGGFQALSRGDGHFRNSRQD